jgi:hypothetical protein
LQHPVEVSLRSYKLSTFFSTLLCVAVVATC